MHYLSSTSVFDSEHYANLATPVHEDDPLLHGEDLCTGYAQSKYVGEGIVRLAIENGLPVVIYRLAYCLGARNGVCCLDDYLVRLIQGCVRVCFLFLFFFFLQLLSLSFFSFGIIKKRI